ncbi:MAG: peptidase M22 [Ethanoligenens sp.]
MNAFLGIDTSNYTTSTALYDTERRVMVQQKRLLPVKSGQKGLRQADAVYLHLKQLPELLEALFVQEDASVAAVGVSVRPRDVDGSYMPCFEAGYCTARAIAAALRVPVFTFSHQAGHIAAALFSADKLDWLERPFVAFHLSGGTTEAVLCQPADGTPKVELLFSSLDLKAGQAVDRVGLLLGLPFPAGPALEALSHESNRSFSIRPSMKGGDCSLSGIENRCAAMQMRGEPDADVARYCICAIAAALDGMTCAVRTRYPDLPLLYAGGVMSNSDIRTAFTERYGAVFARPGFSSDNAAGITILAMRKAGQS